MHAAESAPLFEKSALQIEAQDGRHLTFQVEIARSETQQAYGLMHRKTLPANAGMLFVFAPPRATAFWMKDTPLTLDMLFVKEDGRIAQIHARAKPFDETPIPTPGKVSYVLEIKGGIARKLRLRAGDRIKIPKAFETK